MAGSKTIAAASAGFASDRQSWQQKQQHAEREKNGFVWSSEPVQTNPQTQERTHSALAPPPRSRGNAPNTRQPADRRDRAAPIAVHPCAQRPEFHHREHAARERPCRAWSSRATSNNKASTSRRWTAARQPTAGRRSRGRWLTRGLGRSDRWMRTRASAKRKMFRRTGAADAADSRDENAAAYRRPASARIRRTHRATAPDDGAASRAAARPEAAPAAACTSRSWAPACVRKAQSNGRETSAITTSSAASVSSTKSLTPKPIRFWGGTKVYSRRGDSRLIR